MISFKQLLFKIRHRLLYPVWLISCTLAPEKIGKFVLFDGSNFEYPIKSAVGCYLFTSAFEPAEVAFVQENLKQGDIFFDVGANAGIFTVIAAKKIGSSGHVYAFEPGLNELKLLRHNIAVNNLTNVTVVERAVSSQSGTARFAVCYDGAMNSLAKTDHPGQQIKEWQTIETISLDEFVQQMNIGKINLIKIDVEGAEKLVIEGAKQICKSQDNLILLLEAANLNASSFSYSVWELLSEIIDIGFNMYYFDKMGSLSKVTGYDAQLGTNIYNFIASKQQMPL